MTTSIRLPGDVHQAMKQLADEHGRSLHREIVWACKAWIERYQVVNPKLFQAIQAEIAESRSEGTSEEDVKWMAVGAGIRLAREQGIVGKEVSDEMAAAIAEVVKQELKK
jgi:predicted transcriptional regulator